MIKILKKKRYNDIVSDFNSGDENQLNIENANQNKNNYVKNRLQKIYYTYIYNFNYEFNFFMEPGVIKEISKI